MFRFAQKEHLIVPAHIDHLPSLRDFVTQIGSKYGYSKKLVNAFKIAIDEAATNIIKHAYEGEGYITIQAIIRRKSLTINMIDQGAFFDPKWAKAPDLKDTASQREKVGLGIFMMRKLMDEIGYQKTQAGNELSLTKHDKYRRKPFSLGYLWSLPPALRVRYFINAIILVTLANAGAFSYLYFEADRRVTAAIVESGRKTAKRLGNRLSFDPGKINGPNAESEINSIILPEYRENILELHSITLEDTLGRVAWSTVHTDIDSLFLRPGLVSTLATGALEFYLQDSVRVLEIERILTFDQDSSSLSKVHVFLSGEHINNEIDLKRLYYLKLAAAALGASYILLALLSYIITRPIRKLAEWIKATRQGEIRTDLDIDGSSELGEIAQAFTEITQRFNESQKHLEHRERFEKEIHLAKGIQSSLLPSAIPVLEKVALAAHYEAAIEVSGDYYDFIEIDKDHLGIIIADVSGKGVPGSMVMTMIRTALKTEARGILDAAEVLTRVHEFVADDMKYGMFVTMFYVILDKQACTINFASAGHTPLLLHRACTGKTFYLNPIGCPVGIALAKADFFKNNIESETVQLDADDTLLLYTDGITEARNPKNGSYGEGRLLNQVRKHQGLRLEPFLEKIKNSLYSFREDSPQHDDITMVAIRRKAATDEETAQPIVLDEDLSVETKFLSIEDTTKILDVVSRHPEFDAEQISEELNRPRYKNAEIAEGKIESELIRQKLDTVELRNRHARLCEENQRNANPPGTPRLTLSGNVRLHKRPTVKSVAAGLLKAPEDPPPSENREQPRLPQTPQEILDYAPNIESDFVFGTFIDDLLRATPEFEKLDISDDVPIWEDRQTLALPAPVEEEQEPADEPEQKLETTDSPESQPTQLTETEEDEQARQSDIDDEFAASLFADDISDALVDAILGNIDDIETAAEPEVATTPKADLSQPPTTPKAEDTAMPESRREEPSGHGDVVSPDSDPPAETDAPAQPAAMEIADEPDKQIAADVAPAAPSKDSPAQDLSHEGDEDIAADPADDTEFVSPPFLTTESETVEAGPVSEPSAELHEPEPEVAAQAERAAPEVEQPGQIPARPDSDLQTGVAEQGEDGSRTDSATDDTKQELAEPPEPLSNLADVDPHAPSAEPVEPKELPKADAELAVDEHEDIEEAATSEDSVADDADDDLTQSSIAGAWEKTDPADDDWLGLLPDDPGGWTEDVHPLLPPDLPELTDEIPESLTAPEQSEVAQVHPDAPADKPEEELVSPHTDETEPPEVKEASVPPELFGVASIESNIMDDTLQFQRRTRSKPEQETEDEETTDSVFDGAINALLGRHQPQTAFVDEVGTSATPQVEDSPELQEDNISVRPDFEESPTRDQDDAGVILDDEVGIALSDKGIQDILHEDETQVGAEDGTEGEIAVEPEVEDEEEPEIAEPELETRAETKTLEAPATPEIAEEKTPEAAPDETSESKGAELEPEADAEQPSEVQTEPLFTLTSNVIEDKFLPRPIRKRRRSRRRRPAATEESSEITLSNKPGPRATTPAPVAASEVLPQAEALEERREPETQTTEPEIVATPDEILDTKSEYSDAATAEDEEEQPALAEPEETAELSAEAPGSHALPATPPSEHSLTAEPAIPPQAPATEQSHQTQAADPGSRETQTDQEQNSAQTPAEVESRHAEPETSIPDVSEERPAAVRPAAQHVDTTTQDVTEPEAPQPQLPEPPPEPQQQRARTHADELLSGIDHYKAKQYEDAIIAFKAALKLAPDSMEAYAMLGNAFFRNNMYEEALTAYEQIDQETASDLAIHENIGLIYWKLGQFDAATKAWRDALQNHPERKELARRLEIAETQRMSQQGLSTASREGGTQETTAAPKAEPAVVQNSSAEARKLVQAGIEQYRSNDYESAIQTFRLAINHFPSKQEAYSFLGNAYFRNQMYNEAAEIYERLLSLNDDNTSVLENLAFIHFKQGDYQNAVEKWKRVLAKEPERRDLEDRIEKVTQLL